MTILLDLPSNGDRNSVRCATKPCSMLLSFISLSPPPSPPLIHHTLPGRDFSSHVIKTLSLSPLTAHWRVQTLRNAYPKHYSPLNLASHTLLLLLPYQVTTLSYFDTLNPLLELWILSFLKLKCSVRQGQRHVVRGEVLRRNTSARENPESGTEQQSETRNIQLNEPQIQTQL